MQIHRAHEYSGSVVDTGSPLRGALTLGLLAVAIALIVAACSSSTDGSAERPVEDVVEDQPSISLTDGIQLTVAGVDAFALPQACGDSSTLKLEFPSGCTVTSLTEVDETNELLLVLDYSGAYGTDDIASFLSELDGVINDLNSSGVTAQVTTSGSSATITILRAETLKVDASGLPKITATYSATPDLPAEDGAVIMNLQICSWQDASDCQVPPTKVIDAINGLGGINLLAPSDSSAAVPVQVADDGGLYVPDDVDTAAVFYVFECSETGLSDWQTVSGWAMPIWGGLTDGCPGSLSTYDGPAITSSQACLARPESGDGAVDVVDGGDIYCYWWPEGQDYDTNCRSEEIPATWTWAKQTAAYTAEVCYPAGQ